MRDWEEELTPTQRQEIRTHIRHEWRMVQHLDQALIDLFFDDLTAEWCIRVAVLDSLLMHARNLHGFFLRSPRLRGDVAVSQILPRELGGWKPDGLDTLAAHIEAINKLRSHLTYDMLSDDRSWPAGKLRREIDSAFEQLILVLPESEREFWQA